MLLDVCMGVAGSGKSTWTKRQSNAERITYDAIKHGVPPGIAVGRATKRANRLAGHPHLIVDACNLRASERAKWRRWAAEHGYGLPRLVVFEGRHVDRPGHLERRHDEQWPGAIATAMAEAWRAIIDPEAQPLKAGAMPTQPGDGNPRHTARWRTIRLAVLKQAEQAAAPCHFCGGSIDYRLAGTHPMGPHVDAVVPHALGGSHWEWGNLAPAHNRCNVRAGGKLGAERLAVKKRSEVNPTSRQW